jgi:hypothetical protein
VNVDNACGRTEEIPPHDELALDENKWLWPASKITAFVDIPQGLPDLASLARTADILIASCFYVELEELPFFYSSSPVTVRLVVKCRFPLGPGLTDAMMRLYTTGRRLHYGDDTTSSSTLLCPRSVWAEVKHGRPFHDDRSEERDRKHNVRFTSSTRGGGSPRGRFPVNPSM